MSSGTVMYLFLFVRCILLSIHDAVDVDG